jgi:hypothetical protein
LAGDVAEAGDDTPVAPTPDDTDRLAALEELANALRNEVADLRAQLAAIGGGADPIARLFQIKDQAAAQKRIVVY